MTIALRVLLATSALISFVVGGWAQFWPEGFYTGFPTVDLTPPYSEHLLRDFGGATLGLAVVQVAALIWPQKRLVIVAALASLVFAAPHAAFHFLHLEHATAARSALLVFQMVASVALPVLIILLAALPVMRQSD
ncbi:MAG: hypothetical protein EPN91_11170 [Salinibacterium sp.]|nr:MAG: hypothetical protein EPN91_11170 [Salinibacterium sp.]